MGKMTVQIEKELLVVVEGNDDVRLVRDLLKLVNCGDKLQCINAKGKENIPNQLKKIALDSNIGDVKKIAIILDADRNPKKAELDVEKFFKDADLSSTIETACLIIPKNYEGMLEDVCMQSVSNLNVLKCVDTFLKCIENDVDELPRNTSKSKFLAYMASKPKATNGTVEAALQKGYFDLQHAAFDDIRSFLENFCN